VNFKEESDLSQATVTKLAQSLFLIDQIARRDAKK
jgi:hypothetical protein